MQPTPSTGKHQLANIDAIDQLSWLIGLIAEGAQVRGHVVTKHAGNRGW